MALPVDYTFTAAERFLRYVTYNTQSNPLSDSCPSTSSQIQFAKMLADELKEMGVQNAEADEFGYVYAGIPSNSEKKIPVICFCAHIDTSPDCSGEGIKPIVHKNYQGGDITLPDDPTQVIRAEDFPYLKSCIGHDIITASGTTLLGADDKAGVAEIMDLAHFLIKHPNIPHGAIKILFTPDEEIGRGTEKVNLEKLGADIGYTLDGGEAGVIEDETFSADSVQLILRGISAHPGYAKGKMINALKIAGELLASLPKNRLAPEVTEGRSGFIHPVRVNGHAEECIIEFIIRDFETHGLRKKEDFLRTLTEELLRTYPGASFEFHITEQYRNMKEILNRYPQITEYAKEAVRRAGLEPRTESIRGGTDGSKLSFMGLPCANLFTGMQAIHSRKEHISITDMCKAVETLIHLVMIWEEKTLS